MGTLLKAQRMISRRRLEHLLLVVDDYKVHLQCNLVLKFQRYPFILELLYTVHILYIHLFHSAYTQAFHRTP